MQGGGLWWCIFVDCVSFPVRWLDFWTFYPSVCICTAATPVTVATPPSPLTTHRLLKPHGVTIQEVEKYRLGLAL